MGYQESRTEQTDMEAETRRRDFARSRIQMLRRQLFDLDNQFEVSPYAMTDEVAGALEAAIAHASSAAFDTAAFLQVGPQTKLQKRHPSPIPLDQVQTNWLADELDDSGEMTFLSVPTIDRKQAVAAMPRSYRDFTRPAFAQILRWLDPVSLQVGREHCPVAYLHYNSDGKAAEAAHSAKLTRLASEVDVQDGSTVRLSWVN